MTTVIQFPERDSRPLTVRVSEEIKALMGRHGVSQTRLAQSLGMHQTAISARLRGDTEWKVTELDLIADGFGVHPSVLLGGYATGPRPDDPDRGLAFLLPHLDSNQEPSGSRRNVVALPQREAAPARKRAA